MRPLFRSCLVSFPRRECTAIRPSSSPPAVPILCFGRILAGLPCTTIFPTQRRGARRNERLLHFTLVSARYWYMHASRLSAAAHLSSCSVHFQAVQGCVHRLSRICSSASIRAFPLQPRSGLLRSWGGITSSAVRMMATENATSTSSTLLSPGGFDRRCLPTAGATSCRSWGLISSRLVA